MAQQALNWYTRTYPNFLDDELCDAYVQTFEETMEKDADEVRNTSICYGPQVGAGGQPICGNCNCQRMNPMGFDRFEHLNKLAMDKFVKIAGQYKKDVKLHKSQWPDKYGWEELRMKRFLVSEGGPDAEQFKEHVDVFNREGAKRFLILMVYLNDDFDNGETEFTIFGDKVKPETGKILIFPPLWQYLHRGNPPTGNSYAKYFLMTYLNYIKK